MFVMQVVIFVQYGVLFTIQKCSLLCHFLILFDSDFMFSVSAIEFKVIFLVSYNSLPLLRLLIEFTLSYFKVTVTAVLLLEFP